MADGNPKRLGRMAVASVDARERVLGDAVLSRAALVRALGEAAPAVLARGRVGRLPAGGLLFRAGQPGESVLMVAAGEIAVHAEADVESPVASTVPIGDLVGAGAALGEDCRQVTATAPQETTVIEVLAEALAEAARTIPAVRDVLEAASEREGRAAGEMADFLDRW